MAIVQERFGHETELPAVFRSIYAAIAAAKDEQFTADFADIKLDMLGAAFLLGGNEDEEGNEPERFNLGERAFTQMCDRLGIGRITEILSTETYRRLEREINDQVNGRDGGLIIKHKAGVVNAVLSDDYKEYDYAECVKVLELIGARPIRARMNDTTLKVQVVFDGEEWEPIKPKDGKLINLGVQMTTSDKGASSLKFDMFNYRWACCNGMVFGQNDIYKFRTIHIKDRGFKAINVSDNVASEVKRVLGLARTDMLMRANHLIETALDRNKIVKFLAGREDIGKRALLELAEHIAVARSVWDVVNILTEQGHNAEHTATLQNAFESAAGALMLAA